jgi:hypothetical protein
MAYFTLLTREDQNDRWVIQFGDYNKECVEQEYLDTYADTTPKGCHKFLRTKTARQSEIDKAIAELNKKSGV